MTPSGTLTIGDIAKKKTHNTMMIDMLEYSIWEILMRGGGESVVLNFALSNNLTENKLHACKYVK